MWFSQSIVCGMQILTTFYQKQRNAAEGSPRLEGRVPWEVSPAAAAAYTAGVEALLIHEAALKRDPGNIGCTFKSFWHAHVQRSPHSCCCLCTVCFAPMRCADSLAVVPFICNKVCS